MDIEVINYADTKLLRVTNLLSPGKFNAMRKNKNKNLVNLKFSITENSPIESLGFLYHSLFYNIKKSFLSLGIEKISGTGISSSKNAGDKSWHKHVNEYVNDPEEILPEKFWVAVYYLHSKTDTYGNYVDLKLTQETTGPGLSYPCIPNSCIIHNRILGHSVDAFNLPDVERVALYSHWIEG